MKQLHPEYGFNTLAVHSGTAPDPTTGARSFPIYQTTAYVFDDADHAASLFNLQEPGFIYSRLTNPTVAALEEKLATLEGGRGGTVTSSGHAAETLALFPLMAPGMEVIVADKLYGGTINLMGKVTGNLAGMQFLLTPIIRKLSARRLLKKLGQFLLKALPIPVELL